MKVAIIRRIIFIIIATVTLAVTTSISSAQDALKIQLAGRYYAEPATVDILVALEPSDDNRLLRIETDGANFYRSSDLDLTGNTDRKYHSVLFKNIPAGNYVVRAVLLSANREVATAQTALVVMAK